MSISDIALKFLKDGFGYPRIARNVARALRPHSVDSIPQLFVQPDALTDSVVSLGLNSRHGALSIVPLGAFLAPKARTI